LTKQGTPKVQGPHIEKIPISDTMQGQVLNCEKTLYLQDGAQIHLRVHLMFLYTHNYNQAMILLHLITSILFQKLNDQELISKGMNIKMFNQT
jgi:hypothetical protein